MNKFLTKYWPLIMFMILGLLSFIFMSSIMHEQVHVQIYKHHGVESHIEWFSHFPHVATVADSPCPTPECILAHNINEVVGYTLEGFFIMVYFGFIFVLIKGRKSK